MKKLWLGIVGMAVASTAQAAIVTFTLSIHESPTGTVTAQNQFAVYATVSADNGGLYAYGVDLKTTSEGGSILNNATLINRSPVGSWDIDDTSPNFSADYANSPTGGYPTKFSGYGTGRGISSAPGTDGTVSGVQDLAKGANLVKLYNIGKAGVTGNMDTRAPKPSPFIYPPGSIVLMDDGAGGTTPVDMSGQPVPYKNYATGEAAADGQVNSASTGARGSLGLPPNPAGAPVIPTGSVRLLTGAWTGTAPDINAIQRTVNSSASVWHDTSGAEVFDDAQLQIAFRDLQAPSGADYVALNGPVKGTNQAVAGGIAVTGANNKYISEVDQLADPSLNTGNAPIQTIGDEAGSIYVMAKLVGAAADINTVLTNLTLDVDNSDPEFAKLHAIYDSQFGGGGFNALFKFPNVAGAKTFNWELTGTHGAVTVDQLAAVPEPATMGLMAFAGLGLLARRRRARA